MNSTTSLDSPHLVALDANHPGFRDRHYRVRRDLIAQLADEHTPGSSPATIAYTDAEREVWRTVWKQLRPAHEQHACGAILACQDAMALWLRELPQLAEIDAEVHSATGFRLSPVAGLVQPDEFLSQLGRSVFLCTQYVRHPARPHYTPEPDVLHELIGHAASLTDPTIARINRAFGEAMLRGNGNREALRRLERVYWFTLEYGVVREHGEPRAFGAGLLSSVAEIRGFAQRAELLPWDLEVMARTDYDPTDVQPRLFEALSFEGMCSDLLQWLDRR